MAEMITTWPLALPQLHVHAIVLARCNRQSCCCSTATRNYTHSQWTGGVDPEFQYKQRNSVVTLTRVAKRTRAHAHVHKCPRGAQSGTIVPSCERLHSQLLSVLAVATSCVLAVTCENQNGCNSHVKAA